MTKKKMTIRVLEKPLAVYVRQCSIKSSIYINVNYPNIR